MPSVMVLGDGSRSHEGGSLMNGISALIDDMSQSSLPFHRVRTQSEGGSLQPGRGLPPEPHHAATLNIYDSQFQPPEL